MNSTSRATAAPSQSDPLGSYVIGVGDLHRKLARISRHKEATASSLMRAAALLRSISSARQTDPPVRAVKPATAIYPSAPRPAG